MVIVRIGVHMIIHDRQYTGCILLVFHQYKTRRFIERVEVILAISNIWLKH